MHSMQYNINIKYKISGTWVDKQFSLLPPVICMEYHFISITGTVSLCDVLFRCICNSIPRQFTKQVSRASYKKLTLESPFLIHLQDIPSFALLSSLIPCLSSQSSPSHYCLQMTHLPIILYHLANSNHAQQLNNILMAFPK